jgi:hypothetical protein
VNNSEYVMIEFTSVRPRAASALADYVGG